MLPTDGITTLTTTITDGFQDAWPVFAVTAGVGILVSLLRKFIRV